MKKLLCLFSFHNWQYKKEKHPVSDHPKNRANIYIKVRECKRCGKRQQSGLSTSIFGDCYIWKDFHMSADSTIKFVRNESKEK
jgi:hypothetical protein